jgi:hypothetical protein
VEVFGKETPTGCTEYKLDSVPMILREIANCPAVKFESEKVTVEDKGCDVGMNKA